MLRALACKHLYLRQKGEHAQYDGVCHSSFTPDKSHAEVMRAASVTRQPVGCSSMVIEDGATVAMTPKPTFVQVEVFCSTCAARIVTTSMKSRPYVAAEHP